MNTNSCSPVSDALVDIWHCNSVGIYSHYIAASLGGMHGKTDNSSFFRGKRLFLFYSVFDEYIVGQQVTNAEGIAIFDTIYPGWYGGRATHIHIKVHIGSSLTNIGGAIYAKGGHVSHTGQIFFDNKLTDTVANVSPYSTHTVRRTRNEEDGIYEESNGTTMIVPITFLGNDFTKGVTGEITVGVDPTATPRAEGFGGRPPPNGSRPPGPPRNGSRPSRSP
jgi:protocatechuate 3,4-dioxygenase beta subunit